MLTRRRRTLLAMNSRLNMELHPMQNVEILSTIFSFCSVTDLKSCRLVGSKVWLKASMKSWRENAVLTIRPEPENPGIKAPGMSFPYLQSIYEDESDPFELRKKPFKSLKLGGFRHSHFQHSELSWILENLSNDIRYFALDDYEFESMKSVLETIILQLPNLVELKMVKQIHFSLSGSLFCEQYHNVRKWQYPKQRKLKCIVLEKDVWGLHTFLQWLPTLLKHSANLQEIRAYTRGGTTATHVMQCVALVRREDPELLQLKNLDVVSAPLTEKGFTGPENLENEASLPLKRFTGSIKGVQNLKPYVGSLKFLDMFITENFEKRYYREDSSIDDNDDVGIISFPHLREVHIKGPPREVFQNINKMEAMNLETFVVDHDFLPHKRPRFCEIANININSCFRNVTKFECYNFCKWYLVDLEDVRLLSASMPNVLHLKMPLTREAFKEVCRVWPNLLTLTISDRHAKYKLIDDEAITGIKPGTEIPAEGERPANLTNLKKLTDFVNYSPLTNHSVKFGFLKMPRLYYLNVKFSKISEEAELALRKKVNTFTIQ